MATIDLRHVTELLIIMLENKAGGFEIQQGSGGPVLTDATATMVITLGSFSQTLTVGNGITITGADRFALSLPALPLGVYKYFLEVQPVTGDVMRFIDEIQVING